MFNFNFIIIITVVVIIIFATKTLYQLFQIPHFNPDDSNLNFKFNFNSSHYDLPTFQ
jgi:hypothetical protein